MPTSLRFYYDTGDPIFDYNKWETKRRKEGWREWEKECENEKEEIFFSFTLRWKKQLVCVACKITRNEWMNDTTPFLASRLMIA